MQTTPGNNHDAFAVVSHSCVCRFLSASLTCSQVGTGLTKAKSVTTVFLTPQEESQVGQLYVAHANQQTLLGKLEIFRLMVDITITKKVICQYDYTSPSCDLVAGPPPSYTLIYKLQ